MLKPFFFQALRCSKVWLLTHIFFFSLSSIPSPQPSPSVSTTIHSLFPILYSLLVAFTLFYHALLIFWRISNPPGAFANHNRPTPKPLDPNERRQSVSRSCAGGRCAESGRLRFGRGVCEANDNRTPPKNQEIRCFFLLLQVDGSVFSMLFP